VFARGGFRCLATRRYDYNRCLRTISALASPRSRMIVGGSQPAGGTGNDVAAEMQGASGTAVRLMRRGAIAIDGVLEPQLVKRDASLPVVHCGSLFLAE